MEGKMKHTMLKCLSLVMALATLVSVCALPAIVQAATPCNHYAYTTFGEDSADYVGVKESTCDEWGGIVMIKLVAINGLLLFSH